MKISHRTHPILQVIERETSRPFPKYSPAMSLKDYDQIKQTFEIFVEAKTNVMLLSNAFQEALSLSFDKFQKKELYDEIEGSGIIIKGRKTFVYKIIDNHNAFFLTFVDQKLIFKMFTTGGAATWYIDQALLVDGRWSEKDVLDFECGEVVTALLFIKYADIETKYLPAGQKTKGIDCKYINDTKTNIKHLNITWYTELKKTDGFNVRGHWRLQPKKKNGEWTKEIIWINAFQKTGYSRRPDKELNPEVIAPLSKLAQFMSNNA